jgi:hypothetical protein
MEEKQQVCLVCGLNKNEVPLLAITYKEDTYWICPQHFPTLIHHPEKLAGKLPGAEKLKGHSED